uniref:Uncharacterized protein n=1 Tax=Mycobacterium riyadhense TaxID=486698 RepID=A0A653EX22_9MYCO|nr:hypothetical protein BIN_B_03955 [Mycobacterium riyadhense]
MDGKTPLGMHVRWVHDDLKIRGHVFREGQGGMQDQLVDDGAVNVLTRVEKYLDEAGGGKDNGAVDAVTGQPGVRAGRQAPADHDLVLIGDVSDGAEQGMVGPVESGGPDVDAGGGGQPVAAVLEGVGGQCGGPGVRKQDRPSRAMAVGVQLSDRGGQGVEVGPVAVQRGDRRRLGTSVRVSEGVGDRRG